MEDISILKEAAVLIGVLLVSYLLLLGLFVALFRVFFPFKKETTGIDKNVHVTGARKVVAKFSRSVLKEGRPRKIKLSNG